MADERLRREYLAKAFADPAPVQPDMESAGVATQDPASWLSPGTVRGSQMTWRGPMAVQPNMNPSWDPLNLGPASLDPLNLPRMQMETVQADAPPVADFRSKPAADDGRGLPYGFDIPQVMPRFGPMPTNDVVIPPSGAEQYGQSAIDAYDAPQEGLIDASSQTQLGYAESLGETDAMAQDIAFRQQAQAQAEQESRAFLEQQAKRLEAAQNMYSEALARGINPDRVFENGTVDRVEAALAIAVSGFAAGYMGLSENAALDTLNRIIDRDIEAQTRELQAKGDGASNMLSAYAQAFGNVQAAQQATRMSALDMAENRLRALQSRVRIPEEKTKLELLVGELNQKKTQLAVDLGNYIQNDAKQQFSARQAQIEAEMKRRQQVALQANQLNMQAQLKARFGSKYAEGIALGLKGKDLAEYLGASGEGEFKPKEMELKSQYGEAVNAIEEFQDVLRRIAAAPKVPSGIGASSTYLPDDAAQLLLSPVEADALRARRELESMVPRLLAKTQISDRDAATALRSIPGSLAGDERWREYINIASSRLRRQLLNLKAKVGPKIVQSFEKDKKLFLGGGEGVQGQQSALEAAKAGEE